MSPGNRKFVLQVCKSVSVWKIDWTAPLVCLCLSSPGSPLTSPITVIAQPDPPTSQWPVLTGPWNPKADQSVQLSPTLFNPMDCSTPGFPVHHQLLEFAQTYVHWVGDAIQPPHPLSSPSPPAFSLAQHQGLFQWVSSVHQVAKVLEFQLQHQSFQWTFKTDLLEDWLVWSPCIPRDSQESSPTPQFKSINSLALSFLYGSTLISIHDYWKNHSLD